MSSGIFRKIWVDPKVLKNTSSLYPVLKRIWVLLFERFGSTQKSLSSIRKKPFNVIRNSQVNLCTIWVNTKSLYRAI